MSKASIGEANNENLDSEFKYGDLENQLRKKIKLEHEKIISKIRETNEEIDISEHEVYKFLLIFHTLIETVNSVETEEETDGLVADAILQIVNLIAGLLKSNIDNLTVPAVLKSALKKLKSLIIPQKKDIEEGKPGKVEPENGRKWDRESTEEETIASREGSSEWR